MFGKDKKLKIDTKKLIIILGIITGCLIIACIVEGVIIHSKTSDLSEKARINKVLQEQVEGEKGNISALQAQVDDLSNQVAILSESLTNSKAELEEANAMNTVNRQPTAYPLKGTAAIVDNESDDTGNPEGGNVSSNDVDNGEGTSDNSDKELYVLFQAAQGTSVVATGTGTILSVEEDSKYGMMMKIDHGNGYISIYRGYGMPLVEPGDNVSQGTVIMKIAEDGREFKYQIMMGEEYIDPMSIIQING